MWDCDAYHNIAILRYHKVGLDHICAWESELLVIVVCSYEAHTHWHTAAATLKASHIIQHFSQELTIQIEMLLTKYCGGKNTILVEVGFHKGG